ncbi:MAG: hypothetical protein EPO42_14220 [Gallionellaceae bacterium]|nr:MAG: hypothetical protein EPO42_14220 [Gallionellaceae bacterium]
MGRKAESAAPAPPEPNPFVQLERHAREAAEQERVEKEAAARGAAEAAAAAERARLEADLKEQRDMERCKLIPLPKIATHPFRSEITTEQANLFLANSYKGDWFTYEKTVKHPESDEQVIRRRTIGKVNDTDRPRGVLRQVHGDIWRRLLEIWGEQREHERCYGLGVTPKGLQLGHISMSAYELVRRLRGGSNSAADYKRVQVLLHDLSSIPIVLENVYTWQGYVDRVTFTLLNGVTWTERKIDKKTGRPKPGQEESKVSLFFSEFVTEGFLRKHVKTVLGEPGKKLRGTGTKAELASLLYWHVNTQLATKDEYNARFQGLAEQFGMTRYRTKSERIRKFTPALRAVNGARMLASDEREFFIHMSVRLSADGDDHVIMARRIPQSPGEFVLPGGHQLAIPGIG